jgi:hypothetical protein
VKANFETKWGIMVTAKPFFLKEGTLSSVHNINIHYQYNFDLPRVQLYQYCITVLDKT